MSFRRARLSANFSRAICIAVFTVMTVQNAAAEERPTQKSEREEPIFLQRTPADDMKTARDSLSPAKENHSGSKEKRGKVEVDVIDRGDSSEKTQQLALKQLPLAQLSATDRQRANEILKQLSLFRRMPRVSFESDPMSYQFFTKYPDVAVSIWRVLGISKVQMWQTGPKSYEVDAADGSLAVVDVLHQSAGTNLILCDGFYKSPLLPKPINGKALMNLSTEFSIDDEGKTHATHHVDLFVAFPSTTVETAAKVISPVSNMIADRNFREISLFLRMMSIAMENQPGWVERVADQMEGVLPERKTQLLTTTARIYVRRQKDRLVEKYGSERRVTADDVLTPLRTATNDIPAIPRIAENAPVNAAARRNDSSRNPTANQFFPARGEMRE